MYPGRASFQISICGESNGNSRVDMCSRDRLEYHNRSENSNSKCYTDQVADSIRVRLSHSPEEPSESAAKLSDISVPHRVSTIQEIDEFSLYFATIKEEFSITQSWRSRLRSKALLLCFRERLLISFALRHTSNFGYNNRKE